MSDTDTEVDPEVIEAFLPMIGFEAQDDGRIREIESGEIHTDSHGSPITVNDIECFDHNGERIVLRTPTAELDEIKEFKEDLTEEFGEKWKDPRESE